MLLQKNNEFFDLMNSEVLSIISLSNIIKDALKVGNSNKTH
jgi:hypothetical protein